MSWPMSVINWATFSPAASAAWNRPFWFCPRCPSCKTIFKALWFLFCFLAVLALPVLCCQEGAGVHQGRVGDLDFVLFHFQPDFCYFKPFIEMHWLWLWMLAMQHFQVKQINGAISIVEELFGFVFFFLLWLFVSFLVLWLIAFIPVPVLIVPGFEPEAAFLILLQSIVLGEPACGGLFCIADFARELHWLFCLVYFGLNSWILPMKFFICCGRFNLFYATTSARTCPLTNHCCGGALSPVLTSSLPAEVLWLLLPVEVLGLLLFIDIHESCP